MRSFYKSIRHHKLIEDVKQHYRDTRVQVMLTNIIKNPIETARGCKNADHGIALRGPLSQFFSGLYLKRLDDVISKMEVTYTRYQDDILVLCKTKRQLNRCWRTMLDVLHERQLTLSRKKTRMGDARTLRKARLQVMSMVTDGLSAQQIRKYLLVANRNVRFCSA